MDDWRAELDLVKTREPDTQGLQVLERIVLSARAELWGHRETILRGRCEDAGLEPEYYRQLPAWALASEAMLDTTDDEALRRLEAARYRGAIAGIEDRITELEDGRQAARQALAVELMAAPAKQTSKMI